jgi:predicted SnoaL-like aldol condensation-catalyzing enzyme
MEEMEKNFHEMPNKTYEALRSLEDGDLVAVHGKVGNVFGKDWSVIHIF